MELRSAVSAPPQSLGVLALTGQSGYNFTGANTPFDAGEGTGFSLGTFTHTNMPINAGTSITAATLNVTIQFTGDFFDDPDELHFANSQFIFLHNETTNNANPCADGGANGVGVNINGCADIVTAFLNPGSFSQFLIGGINYTFGVTGFQIPGGSFSSQEDDVNSVLLQGSFAAVDTFNVPGPAVGAGLPALVAACLGLFGLQRRRRQKVAA